MAVIEFMGLLQILEDPPIGGPFASTKISQPNPFVRSVTPLHPTVDVCMPSRTVSALLSIKKNGALTMKRLERSCIAGDLGTRHDLPSFVIRRPRGRDLQSLHHLVDSTYEPMIARLGLPDWPLRTNIPQLIHSGTLWVLESKGLITAMIRLDVHWKFVWLELVTVLPERQRCGFGRALIEFAQSETRNQRRSSMQLVTHERMIDAIGFYLHMGFVEVQRLQLQGHPFVQMRKAVSPLSQ